ncbi:hypothetical protein LXL04_039052 [Taraxacum kok-saghyz]
MAGKYHTHWCGRDFEEKKKKRVRDENDQEAYFENIKKIDKSRTSIMPLNCGIRSRFAWTSAGDRARKQKGSLVNSKVIIRVKVGQENDQKTGHPSAAGAHLRCSFCGCCLHPARPRLDLARPRLTCTTTSVATVVPSTARVGPNIQEASKERVPFFSSFHPITPVSLPNLSSQLHTTTRSDTATLPPPASLLLCLHAVADVDAISTVRRLFSTTDAISPAPVFLFDFPLSAHYAATVERATNHYTERMQDYGGGDLRDKLGRHHSPLGRNSLDRYRFQSHELGNIKAQDPVPNLH